MRRRHSFEDRQYIRRDDEEAAVHTYSVKIAWQDRDGAFPTGKYSRAHTWSFDGGAEVPASSSPLVVPLPYSDAGAVDPEEAFVASVSSCHMLTFLYVAYKAKLVISSYIDEAVGYMEKNQDNQEWLSRVELRPKIAFEGRSPERDELEAMHEKAHHGCYIANSVKSEIKIIY